MRAHARRLLLLNASRNPLGGAGLAHLSEGLRACASLRALNLCNVGLTDADLGALGALADALAVNTSIENIDLDSNFFGAKPSVSALMCFDAYGQGPWVEPCVRRGVADQATRPPGRGLGLAGGVRGR